MLDPHSTYDDVAPFDRREESDDDGRVARHDTSDATAGPFEDVGARRPRVCCMGFALIRV